MSSKFQSAPWGTKIRVVTGIVVGLGITAAIALPRFLRDGKAPMLLQLLPTIVVVAIFAGTGLFVVRGFEVSDKQLLVTRSFWKTAIDLADLTSVEADPKACKGAFKTLGNDGVFAMCGRFYSKKLKSFRAFVPAPKNSVILKFATRTIVVSPQNPKSFADELNRRLKLQKGKS